MLGQACLSMCKMLRNIRSAIPLKSFQLFDLIFFACSSISMGDGNLSDHISWVLWFHPRLFVRLVLAVFPRNCSLHFPGIFCMMLGVNNRRKLTESIFQGNSHLVIFRQNWPKMAPKEG